MIPLARIEEIAASRPDHAAVIAGRTVLSWNQYATAVRDAAEGLAGAVAIDELRTIAFLSHNRAELVVAASAAATLKSTLCGLDYSLTQEALADLLDRIEADCLIVSSAFLADRGLNARALAGGRPVIDLDNQLPGATGYAAFQGLSAGRRPPNPPARPFRAISFTSGTSGRPKPVIRNGSFDARRFAYFTARYGFSSADRHLATIPFYHAAGGGWARLFLQLGATLVLAPPDDAVEAAELIRREWITSSTMTPPILSGVLRHVAQNRARVTPNQLRFVLVGGKHFPAPAKQEALQVLGPVVYEYYGTTETGVNTIAEPADLLTHPASVGRVYDGNRILILDPERRPVPAGIVGSVAIASYMNMDGYLGAAANKVQIDGERYLVTSEAGYLDEDGRLFLLNRSQGADSVNLYALENAIRQIRGVDDVALVRSAGPGPVAVHCAVVLKASAPVPAGEIEARVADIVRRERVALARFELLDQIPYSPSGKVRAAELESAIGQAGARAAKTAAAPPKPAKAGGKAGGKADGVLLGIALLALTAVSWGGMFPVAKAALASIDGFHLTLLRYGLASVILLGILAKVEGLRAFALEGHGGKLFFYGSMGFAGFSILAFVGLANSKAEHGAIIMALMPLITVLLTWAIKGVKPGRVTFLCIAAALAGVALVVTRGSLSALGGGALLPDLLILAGAASWVVYTLGAASVPGWSTLRYTALSAALGTVTIVAVTALATVSGFITVPTPDTVWSVRGEIAYLVLIAAVLAVFSWNIGIKLLGPINGVLFINLVPITAFAIGLAQGREFGQAELAGAGLTIGALIVNNLNSRGLFRVQWPAPAKPVGFARTVTETP
ncbi:acyl-CoA synthetase (AMP-forming)/AMP-acid ligase II/drug/metabolite transporter (DMT)-like permease [Azospirillum agricola]|uniref:AMP-binding protein n=1 Tax=Azospirillum agricola TaxID=1720247 RepID=UPI001AEAAFC0|nr:AMP-binding protein [Azospirillum agricola]MBP2229202.1 acyl-CoA synthetase (AMP-forming)/AMP-acid ligase II/drug/metabolite transporter (DMT)-like permease [Azospirillum agricola]